jgi:hypothetical protein
MAGQDVPGSVTFLKSQDPQFWCTSLPGSFPPGVTHLKCDACHRMVDLYGSARSMRSVGLTGQLMCYECFNVAQLECQECHGIFPRNKVAALDWFKKIFCLTCEPKAQLQCRDCHKTFPRAEIHVGGDFNEIFCVPCWEQTLHWCGSD